MRALIAVEEELTALRRYPMQRMAQTLSLTVLTSAVAELFGVNKHLLYTNASNIRRDSLSVQRTGLSVHYSLLDESDQAQEECPRKWHREDSA